MDRFPKEILSNIFILLHQTDKVECLTVCRYWKETLWSINLLETVYITSNGQLDNLVKLVEQDPKLGSQTNRLIMETEDFCEREMPNLPKLFPKVRAFYLNHPHVETNTNIAKCFHLWRDNLESISESQSSNFTTQLLASGVYQRLTSISVYKLKNISFRGFIELLGNAPNLKSLAMTHLMFTFHDLERIHNITPRLKRISMINVFLEGQRLPENIQPANSITSISFNITNGWDIQSEILQYIRMKYINLEECTLADSFNRMIPDDQREFRCSGLVPLFQILGKKLKNLNIRFSRIPPRLFNHLDNAECQIESLKLGVTWSDMILWNISKSNQAQFIRSLDLNDIDFYDFSFLKEFPALKKLFLTSRLKGLGPSKQKETNLNCILDACGDRLELLFLHGFRLSCTFSRCRVYPIRNLTLKCIVLPKTNIIDYFFAMAFPQLQSLKLTTCELDKYNEGLFRLPFHNLSYLEIEENFKEDNYILLNTIISIEQEQQQKSQICQPSKKHPYRRANHFFKEENSVTRGYKNSLPYLYADDKLFLTFECASVRTLTVLRS